MMDISRYYFIRFLSISSKYHLLIGLLIRFLLIACGEYIDQTSEVPFTDIDYKVVTDAARYIYHNQSPYERQTYRYSPILAILLIPNIWIPFFGKILFSIIDTIVGILILKIVVQHLRFTSEEIESNLLIYGKYSMLMWIYNPMSIIIATRGNSDSIAAVLVLATLYYIYVEKDYFKTGLLHGLACHFRIYPIVFSLTLFMHLSTYSRPNENKTTTIKVANSKRTIFKKEYLYYLVPNVDQIRLILGSIYSFFGLICLFYFIYGTKFLHETYLYHLIRKDTRHNFSIYFYIQYLTADIKNLGFFHKFLMVAPNLVMLVVISVRYGLHKYCLFFGVFAQAFTLVAYNTVMTSQYFIWFLSILPLIWWHFRMTTWEWLKLGSIWLAGQGAWLLAAYFLEFKGHNTFLFVWWQSVGFFAANILIFSRLIKHFSPLIVDKRD